MVRCQAMKMSLSDFQERCELAINELVKQSGTSPRSTPSNDPLEGIQHDQSADWGAPGLSSEGSIPQVSDQVTSKNRYYA